MHKQFITSVMAQTSKNKEMTSARNNFCFLSPL